MVITQSEITFNAEGLVPIIAQQHDTGEVLMMAWADIEAITKTLESGYLHYWSRSRKKLWKKGETSGQLQKLKELKLDCDGDTLLAVVEQVGVACHKGTRTCFSRSLDRNGNLTINQKALIKPEELYKK